MRLLQACDEKLRTDLLEAVVLPLRLAKAKVEKESDEKRKAHESSYRCSAPVPHGHFDWTYSVHCSRFTLTVLWEAFQIRKYS